MEMSKMFYIALVYCSFSIIAFGQYYDELEFEHDSQLDINKWIEKNPQATKLKFSYMFDPNRLPDKLPYQPNIKELSLISCDLYNLPDWSDSLPNVEKVVIKDGKYYSPENYSGQPGNQILDLLSKYEMLRELVLFWQSFELTLDGINQLENLEELYIYLTGLPGIPEDICELDKLKIFNIDDYRKLSEEDFDVLSRVESLERFEYDCECTSEGLYKLQQIHTLQIGPDLDISQLDFNRLPNVRNVILKIESLEYIPESLEKAENIRYISIIYLMHGLGGEEKAGEREAKMKKVYEKLLNIDATKEYETYSLY